MNGHRSHRTAWSWTATEGHSERERAAWPLSLSLSGRGGGVVDPAAKSSGRPVFFWNMLQHFFPYLPISRFLCPIASFWHFSFQAYEIRRGVWKATRLRCVIRLRPGSWEPLGDMGCLNHLMIGGFNGIKIRVFSQPFLFSFPSSIWPRLGCVSTQVECRRPSPF